MSPLLQEVESAHTPESLVDQLQGEPGVVKTFPFIDGYLCHIYIIVVIFRIYVMSLCIVSMLLSLCLVSILLPLSHIYDIVSISHIYVIVSLSINCLIFMLSLSCFRVTTTREGAADAVRGRLCLITPLPSFLPPFRLFISIQIFSPQQLT